MKRLAILLAGALVLVGCGGNGDQTNGDASREAEPAPVKQSKPKPKPQRKPTKSDDGPLDIATADSGVEGVPIPTEAEPSTGIDGAWIVPGATYKQVVDWYEFHMPEGEGFGRWDWCDTGGGEGISADESLHGHIYARGARDILSVAITNDDPPGILIGADKSGPC